MDETQQKAAGALAGGAVGAVGGALMGKGGGRALYGVLGFLIGGLSGGGLVTIVQKLMPAAKPAPAQMKGIGAIDFEV